MDVSAFVSGCSGKALTADERAFFAAEQPWGLILFLRNCGEPAAIGDLVADFRSATGRPDAPVLIDQEGGRVQRLKPPQWHAYPACATLGLAGEREPEAGVRAAWLQGRLIAADLHELGITVDCAPVLDLRYPGASNVVGDRSFGSDPALVARLARAYADGLLAGGVLPVVKHAPGHGRTTVDSHHQLPVVDADQALLEDSDFKPFADLADLPLAMTGHIVFTAIDSDHPATTSVAVIRDIIRKRIKFDGLLFSDDVSMKALSGSFGDKTRAIHAAGCDVVLYCEGRMEEMREVARASRPLTGRSMERAQRALAALHRPEPFDRQAGWEELSAIIARGGQPAIA
jgi:beta-N-acetylhexosaminidase